MRFVVISLALAVIAGCASQQEQAQSRADAARQEMRALVDDLLAQQSSIRALDPIRDKIYFGRDVRETPLSLYAIREKPTPAEQKALEAWQQWSASTAYPRAERFYSDYQPWYMPILQLQRAAQMSLLADLYVGNIPYGEFNKRRVDIANSAIAASEQRRQEIQAMAVQQAQTQAIVNAQQSMATSAALQAFSGYLQRQQLINQQFLPTRIAPFTCTRYGNTTNCF